MIGADRDNGARLWSCLRTVTVSTPSLCMMLVLALLTGTILAVSLSYSSQLLTAMTSRTYGKLSGRCRFNGRSYETDSLQELHTELVRASTLALAIDDDLKLCNIGSIFDKI